MLRKGIHEEMDKKRLSNVLLHKNVYMKYYTLMWVTYKKISLLLNIDFFITVFSMFLLLSYVNKYYIILCSL